MADTTNKRPTIQDSDLHEDTVIYRVCKPRVRAVEINVLEEIATILNFRPSGVRVAREMIRRQHGENITISCTDAEGAEALWPDLPEAARLTKFVRAKRNLMEDQNNSNFRFIWKVARQVDQKPDGSYYGLPSKYRPGDYWSVSDELQFRSNEKGREFLSMSPYKCRQVEREILSEILAERECTKIFRLRKRKEEKEIKEKSPSLPCKCDCASCAQCAAKSATASEANGREALRKIPNEVLEVELDKFADFFERYLRECGAIDKKFTYAVKRAHHALEMAEASASDLIIRENTGQRLRLVGGQPK